jgi:hypothetical protein
VVIVLKQLFKNQCSCLVEIQSLVFESYLVEKFHFQVVNFVCIHKYAFSYPSTMLN